MTKLLIVAVFATCLAMAMAYYPKYCGDPETPDQGGFKPDRKVHALKDRVDFYCKNRYRLVGATSAVCTYDRKTGKVGWSNPSPKCVGELRSRLLDAILVPNICMRAKKIFRARFQSSACNRLIFVLGKYVLQWLSLDN